MFSPPSSRASPADERPWKWNLRLEDQACGRAMHGVVHGRYAGSAHRTDTTALPLAPHPWQRSTCLRSSTAVCEGSVRGQPKSGGGDQPDTLAPATLNFDAVSRPKDFELRGIERSHRRHLLFSIRSQLRLSPRGRQCYGRRMCGRAKLETDVSEIKVAFRVPPEYPTPNFAPSWNVAPTDTCPSSGTTRRRARVP
jgi:hypothetical protein